MEKDEIIQLLKSKDIEDRKLGVILLSKVCKDRQEFKDVIRPHVIRPHEALTSSLELTTIYHSADWQVRVYMGLKGFVCGDDRHYTISESLRDFGIMERYELDI